MKKVAVLLDGGSVKYNLYKPLGGRLPTAEEMQNFGQRCVKQAEEELFRIYYYDCPPFPGKKRHPFLDRHIDFKQTPQYKPSQKFCSDLASLDYIAFRSGVLMFKGWTLTDKAWERVCESCRQSRDIPALSADDIEPLLMQKRVDIKIGLDIAWLSSKKIVDKIILVTADTDFIPAMKFARREAIHVVLVDLGNVSRELKAHADEIRQISFP
jgi:uncharacterized LabA/DUF88 family protein